MLSSGNGGSNNIIVYGDTDTTPSSKSGLIFQGYHNGSRAQRAELDWSGQWINEIGAIFNDSGADSDFRVESDSNTHALFVDAGNNQVVVGTSAPITGVGAQMTIGGGTDTRLAIDGSTSSGLYLTDSGTSGITIRNASGNLEFYGALGKVVAFNEGSIDTDFRVESDTNSHRLFLEAGTDRIGMGTSNPGSNLHVVGGAGSMHCFLGYFGRETSNVTANILTVSDQAFNSGTAIYARIVATAATSNDSAVIEFWASLSRVSGGANTATAVTPVVAKAIAGTGISAGTLAWSGTTLQYTPSSTVNYVGYSMELHVSNRDSATITVLP